MDVAFLTPEAALLAVGAIVPVALLLDGEKRAQIVRLALGLGDPPPSQRRVLVGSIVGVLVLLGLACAQPVLDVESGAESRQDTEVWFVLDTSRSMLASRTLDDPTRFDRALADARAIRTELAEVPSGIASLTDRLLPHVFPTEDAGVFHAVLERTVGIDKPPPATFNVTATTLGSLSALANRNMYTREIRHRVAIVFTDAESRPFASASLGQVFRRPPGISTVFIRYGDVGERVFTLDGGAESGYSPDPNAPRTLRLLADATGGDAFDERQVDAVAGAVRRAIGRGETQVSEDERREIPLAPYSVALAFVPLGLLLWRRNL
jgi:hypothetical protein